MDLQSLRQYIVKRERLERAVFVGPADQTEAVRNCLDDNGWRIVWSGLFSPPGKFPECDPTQFRIVAECVLEKGT